VFCKIKQSDVSVDLGLEILVKTNLKKLQILTVPSLLIFKVIMYVNLNNLIQPHNHRYNTRNYNGNPSVQHNLKIFEIKPSYVGIKYFSKLPPVIKENLDINKLKNRLKSYLIEECYYGLPDLL
jgi:hypothetical protein